MVYGHEMVRKNARDRLQSSRTTQTPDAMLQNSNDINSLKRFLTPLCVDK